MAFLSYAQNFEDVILGRVLADVENGFYVDVGAYDPAEHSVTKAFHDAGWRGVNIEPVAALFGRFLDQRPSDINLHAAVGAHEGSITFFEVPDTGLSTTEVDVAAQHRGAGYTVHEVTAPATTLARIWADHVRGEVHFLKIDVEGGTRAILEGADFSTWRPWIIVVEATKPMTQVTDFESWEDLLLSNGYSFQYADGLNRFYLAAEHADLADRFAYPPNVFDDFQMSPNHWSVAPARTELARLAAENEALGSFREKAEALAAEGDELRKALDLQIRRNRDAEKRAFATMQNLEKVREKQASELAFSLAVLARLDEREAMLEAIYRSSSWRLTRPLRKAARLIRREKPQLPASGMRRPSRPTIFVECTHTYHSDLNTGIQRVVRNVLRNAPELAAEAGYDVVPVIVENGRLQIVDAGPVLANKQADTAPPSSASAAVETGAGPSLNWRGRVHAMLRPVWRWHLRMLATLMPSESARRFIYAPASQPGLARTLYWPVKRLRGLPEPASAAANAQDALTLDDYGRVDGSILLLLDSSWPVPLWPATGRFKERGGRVVGVIYDLIPLTHSHTCVAALVTAFEDWIGHHIQLSDGFICISNAIAQDLRRYMHETGAETVEHPERPIEYFHLGSELDFILPGDAVRPSVRAIFEVPRHVFVQVGSIEPRKNHPYVLEAFNRFWREGSKGTLIVIGRHHWKSDAYMEEVHNHPEYGKQLFLLRDVTDAELDYAYRHASALIIASQVEGFGLPVVEAFQRGLPVLCSDIPVFREIAEGRAEFFSPDDPTELTAALDKFCRDVPTERKLERHITPWIGWRESTDQLLGALFRIIGPEGRDRA